MSLLRRFLFAACVVCGFAASATAQEASYPFSFDPRLTVTAGKTLTVNNTLTLSGTDASTLNIGAGGSLGSNAYTSTAYAPLASPTFSGTVTTAGHVVDAGTALSGGDFVFGAGAGTSPTITTTVGTDRRFRVTITTGTTPSASAAIFTLTFKNAFSATPFCSITAESAGAGQKITSVYGTPSTTTFVLNADATALTAAAVYQWSFECLG